MRNQVVRRLVRFLVGDLSLKSHGFGKICFTAVRALFTLPFTSILSLWFILRRRKIVLGLVSNANLIPSNFLDEYERLRRAHAEGQFGRAVVVLASDRIPVGRCLWREISHNSRVIVPNPPWLLQCLIPNKFVIRLRLIHDIPGSRVRELRSLPAQVPPSHGAPPPSGLRDLKPLSFVCMQVARLSMQTEMQLLAGRKKVIRDSGWPRIWIPEVATYERALMQLESQNVKTVDLYRLTGNPSDLLRFRGAGNASNVATRDEIQTWLYANCELFLAGASGAWWIAWALGRPTLFTDCYNFDFDNPYSRFLPALLWDSHEKRLLTLHEMWAGRTPYRKYATANGRLEVVNNSSEEIAEAVLEMLALGRGQFESDASLQFRVRQIANFAAGKPSTHKNFPMIGEGFLRRHPEILD